MIDDWQEALTKYLVSVRFERFRWGRHDCCTFARDALEAMTGRQVELPNYSTATEAESAMGANGASTVSEWVTSILGSPVAPEEGSIVQLKPEYGSPICSITEGPLGVLFEGKVYTPGRAMIAAHEPGGVLLAWKS